MPTKNPKEITLYIRVEPDFKQFLEEKASEIGLKVSSYARMKLVQVSGYRKAPNSSRD